MPWADATKAIFGIEKKVKFLDGTELPISKKGPIQPDEVLRISNAMRVLRVFFYRCSKTMFFLLLGFSLVSILAQVVK